MESFSGDTEEGAEEIPGRKKSKLKVLKTRLFGRTKRAGGEEDPKLSQSVTDITAGKGLGSQEDLVGPQGMMGSRALSADSIFLGDQVLTEAEPAKVLSQENVHGKIKALQMKLQQQKMHLGPPPMVVPIKRQEDLGSRSEDDGPPQSPVEISGEDLTSHEAFGKAIPQQSTRPLSPVHKPTSAKYVPQAPSHPSPLSSPSNSSVVEPPLDFSSPAQFNPILDTSAARHRMSVKPKNQRASTKKRHDTTDSRSRGNSLNNIDHPEPVIEEEVKMETEQGEPVVPIASQRLPCVAPVIPSEAASKSSSLAYTQQDQALPEKAPPCAPSLVLRVKPQRAADAKSSERPHSSFIQSELRDNREEGGFEIQAIARDRRNALNKAGRTDQQLSTNFGPTVTLRSSSVRQRVQDETESTRGIKRPGSGSFHFSITAAKSRDEDRPRSGSFAGGLDQTEARQRTLERPFSSLREREDLGDSQPRGRNFGVGRLRQEGGAQPKSAVLPWERKDSLKKVEPVTPSEKATMDTGVIEGKEVVEVSQEVVVEEMPGAQEAVSEEAKTAFGIKLRSTSQSLKYRSEASPKHKPVCEEPGDTQRRQGISDNASPGYKKLSTNLPSAQSTSDPSPSDLSLPVQTSPPSTGEPHVVPAEVNTTSPELKEDDPVLGAPREPSAASSEVSWMSLAMEKTRCLQQLFTSRFPRDFTGAQTASQTETTSPGAQTQTQAVKIQSGATPPEDAHQPSTDAVKAETAQSGSQSQTAKPSLVSVQQKTSTSTFVVQSSTSREPQALKQTSESQAQPNTSHPTTQTNPPWKTQSPLHSTKHTEISPQSAQGSVTQQSLAQSYLSSGQQQQQQQQPPWSNRGLQTANQLRSATSPPNVTTAHPTPVPATVQGKENTSPPGRRAFGAGSVSGKAAFLEKQADRITTPGTKGVESKKPQTEVQMSGEPLAVAKAPLLRKDMTPEARQGVKPAESSPTKVPDRPLEDKWLRRNVASSASPSSSPTRPSALQSRSESGQPSWMELAKRKSMAWSDKSMD